MQAGNILIFKEQKREFMKLAVMFLFFSLSVLAAKAQDMYIFESSTVDVPEISQFRQEVPLSKELCMKLAQFDLLYTRRINRSSNQVMPATQIIKPDLYYSIRKLADYYCKCLRKGIISKEDAEGVLKNILEKSIQIALRDTAPIEAELRLANNPQEIVGVFDKIIIK